MNTLKSLFVVNDRVLEEELPITSRVFLIEAAMLIAASAAFVVAIRL